MVHISHDSQSMIMQLTWRAVVLAAALITVGARAEGQAPAAAGIDTVPVLSGARVRVSAPALGPQPTVFRFAAIRGDTLLLRPAKGNAVDTTRVALANVTRVEASRGWRQRALVGAGIGAVIGAAVGAIIGFNASESVRQVCEDCEPQSRGFTAFVWGASGAGYGGGAGALVARFAIGERWQVVAGR
jgi:hypothetical protein